MDGGSNPKNITYIYDQYDNSSYGFVNYAWWTNTVTIVETQEVTTGTNNITFEETSSTLSLNASTAGSVTMTYIDGQAEPGTLPAEANATSEYYWNAQSNGVTFTDGAIGIPLDSLDTSVRFNYLNLVKVEKIQVIHGIILKVQLLEQSLRAIFHLIHFQNLLLVQIQQALS